MQVKKAGRPVVPIHKTGGSSREKKVSIMNRTTMSFVRGSAVALLLACAPIHSLAAKDTARPAAPIEASIEKLKPGQYVWQPEREESGPVEVVISLSQQKAYVYRSGTLIGASTISSGKPGHESPVGAFEILQKRKDHRSNKYNSAPMPFMQRLNWYGVALHGGNIPGYPASHGCIRLPMKFAEKLYGVTPLGAKVVLLDHAPDTPEEALAMARVTGPAPTAASAGAAP